MKELVTARLALRPYREGDIDHVVRLYGDAVVNRYTKLGRRTQAQARTILEDHVATWRRRGFGMFAVFLKEDDTFVGESGFFELGPAKLTALRYALFESYWGRGLAAEAMTAALGWAFAELGAEEVVAVAQKANVASRRVLEKLGMEIEREGRDGAIELLIYRLEAGRWRASGVAAH